MLAKLRAESGTSSRSDDVMTVLMVLLVVSIGWLASEGPRSRTSTDSRTDCGWSVTTSTGWLLTAVVVAVSSQPVLVVTLQPQSVRESVEVRDRGPSLA